MQREMKEFGRQAARLSPPLAAGVTVAAVVAWAVFPAPAAFWLGNLALGMLVGLVVVKLYKTGDGAYVVPGAILLALPVPVTSATVGLFEPGAMVGGLLAMIAGITLTIALKRQSVLGASEHNA